MAKTQSTQAMVVHETWPERIQQALCISIYPFPLEKEEYEGYSQFHEFSFPDVKLAACWILC